MTKKKRKDNEKKEDNKFTKKKEEDNECSCMYTAHTVRVYTHMWRHAVTCGACTHTSNILLLMLDLYENLEDR